MAEPTDLERAVARVIARADGVDPDAECAPVGDGTHLRYWELEVGRARAVIAECFRWQPIETAPRNGTRVLCWGPEWDHPDLLIWKLNQRVTYFGDPLEMDDYALAKPENRPTHWMPLPPLPDAGHE